MARDRSIVTIDGPSGAGKSTVSRILAVRLGYTYLDTGAMYRAVGLHLQRAGVALEGDDDRLARLLAAVDLQLLPNEGGDIVVLLHGEDVSAAIRTPEMAMAASRVSAHPLVRRTLTELQRRLGAPGGIVAEGRDMGTVVFPEAELKFYLDADPKVRARRRCEQLQAQGQTVAYEQILAQIIKRDRDDSARALAPLKPAADAVIVDSSDMDIKGVIGSMLAVIARNRKILWTRRRGMLEARVLKRRHLIYYLEVYNQEDGELLGHLVDITARGMKLVSKQPLPVDTVFHLQMMVPEGYFPEKELLITARALWTSNDVNPDFFDTGFELIQIDGRAIDLISQLIAQLGFNE